MLGSAGAWLASLLLARLPTRLVQWLKGGLGISLAIAGAVALAVVLVVIARNDVEARAIAMRDATWRDELARASRKALEEQRAKDKAAADAAARARKAIEDQRDQVLTRNIELEQLLAKYKGQAEAKSQPVDDNPVIFPREIVRSLRK